MDVIYERRELLKQLHKMANLNGKTQADIARTVGLNPSNISRMFKGTHPCTIDLLIKVADAIGAKVALVDKP